VGEEDNGKWRKRRRGRRTKTEKRKKKGCEMGKWGQRDKRKDKKREQRKQRKKGEGNGKEFENGRRGHFKRGIFEGQMDGRADLTLGKKMNE
jgi:hypothetical protein